MPNRHMKLNVLAHGYIDQCRHGDTTHAHALEDLIARGFVTQEELKT